LLPLAALLPAAPVGFLVGGTWSICEFVALDEGIGSGALELVRVILIGAALFPRRPSCFLSETLVVYTGDF